MFYEKTARLIRSKAIAASVDKRDNDSPPLSRPALLLHMPQRYAVPPVSLQPAMHPTGCEVPAADQLKFSRTDISPFAWMRPFRAGCPAVSGLLKADLTDDKSPYRKSQFEKSAMKFFKTCKFLCRRKAASAEFRRAFHPAARCRSLSSAQVFILQNLLYTQIGHPFLTTTFSPVTKWCSM